MKLLKTTLTALALCWITIFNATGQADTAKPARLMQKLALAPPDQGLTPDTVRLKAHITTLASAEMEGRETGTAGEKRAYDYLASEFRQVGLQPLYGEDLPGYIQPFTFNAGSYAGPDNHLKIGKKSVSADKGFYPLAWSSNAGFKGKVLFVKHGIAAPGRDDYEGLGSLKDRVAVMEYGYPEGMDLHSREAAFADHRTRIDSAAARGAVAVIFINSDPKTDHPARKISNRITPGNIPVMFVEKDFAEALKASKAPTVSGHAEILKNEKTGHNVVGYLDNRATNTIVIGAHYDHLGYGIEGSLFRGDAKAIHHGADDNASGTGGLLELARLIKKAGYSNYNFKFIAFSGEEMGLLGSSHLVKHMDLPAEKINAMINMDMIGRLKQEEPVLIINGAGTSPQWKTMFDKINVEGLKTKTSESGLGPSDHASFYLKDIPVLHFFSGSHEDYHKPSDTEEKINYAGTQMILDYIMKLLQQMNDAEKMAFTKTDDSKNEETPRFKVTLGVVPDYGFEGDGMRIEGVSDGKPAQKAGLKAGDVVTKIGEHKVTDMMSYMRALSKFTKGDKAPVTVKRGEGFVTVEAEF